MNNRLLSFRVLLFLNLSLISYSQNGFYIAETELLRRGEIFFKFELMDKNRINLISEIISIDKVDGFEVYAYANREEFENFSSLKIPFTVLPHPGEITFNPKMSDNISQILEWDYYPTYEAYVSMMNSFSATYPNLCRIVNAGQTVQGRHLLFAVISDNVITHEEEPQFQYSSSMHGDEVTGYVLMLRLINYLLTNYGTDTKVTSLVNNTEIWINPLANPDGTYRAGNHTVNGATRYNANNKDLNRNFPDPTNPNPNPPFQPETIAMMNLASSNNFVLSANFHGGAEVVNYPWDTWARLTADDNWWVRVSRKYADTVHVYSEPGYMTYLNNGITNGYAWYRVVGGRQDYMCFYQHGRECTIELSDTKILPPAQLPSLWNYNYRSLLNYIEQCQYGIRGIINDSLTGQPLQAKINVVGHDIDSSEIYSDSVLGNYHRMIYTGIYTLCFSASGYFSKTIPNVYSKNDSTTILNVQLRPIQTGIKQISSEFPRMYYLHHNYPNPFNSSTVISFLLKVSSFTKLIVYDILGKEVATLVNEQLQPGKYEVDFDGADYPSGIYYYKLNVKLSRDKAYTETKKMVLIK